MAEKKKEEFVVVDRRKFTAEGERRSDEETLAREAAAPTGEAIPVIASGANPAQAAQATPADLEQSLLDEILPVGPADAFDAEEAASQAPPSASEQQAQQAAYDESKRQMDESLKSALGGRSPRDLEVTFERFITSIYVSAMMQLGLMQEQGGRPQVDLIGARHTIDTIGMISDKTKGNLTSAEQNFIQNCLYDLRMAYLEVTNALTRPPEAGAADPGRK
jgi:hypothetical protein